MLIALSGVTGVGKSFFIQEISKRLDISKVRTIRTRVKRNGEIAGVHGIFLTEEQLDDLQRNKKIAYEFSVFGGRYAYLKEDVFNNKNMIFEMHYEMVDDWKKLVPDIKTIYILPNNLDMAISKLKERNMSTEKEIERINETKKQYDIFINDENWRKKFDYIIYNDYTENSVNNLINIITKIIEEI